MQPLDITAETGQVDAVVGIARDAQSAWGEKSPRVRAVHIRQIRRRIVAFQDEIASVISLETTRPRTEALMQEVTASLALLHHIEKRYPKWLIDTRFRSLKPGFWAKSNRRTFDAAGVIAVIGPSTFPFSLVVMQTCAALMCGNTVVLKPSEKCPKTTALLKSVFSDSVLPRGVVCIAEGDASVVESLIANPGVNKVLFTGSSASGRRIAELCGRHFKPCLLELGGLGTAIVCNDADLELAVNGLLWSASYANGKACIGTRRVLVFPEVKAQFIEKLNDRNRSLVAGRLSELRSDVAEGNLLTIHDAAPISPSGTPLNTKDPVTNPVLEIVTVSDIEEAIGLVNGSKFGLSGSVWSRNVSRAQSVAQRLKVGMVWINDASVALPDFPWGGFRDSGWGSLFARESIPELTRMKTISAERRRFGRPKPWWFPYSKEKYEMTRAANIYLFGRRDVQSIRTLIGATWRYVFRRTDTGPFQQPPFGNDDESRRSDRL